MSMILALLLIVVLLTVIFFYWHSTKNKDYSSQDEEITTKDYPLPPDDGFFETFKLKDVPKISNKAAVLVELGKSKHIRFCIKNVMSMLRNDWSLYILYCDDNIDHIKKQLHGEVLDNVNFIRVGRTHFDPFPEKYNTYFTSEELWNSINAEHILIFQTDSYMRKPLEPEELYLQYDYIGAPWFKEFKENISIGGNGGFSLRTKSSHLNVIKNYPYSIKDGYIAEDEYFSKYIHESGGKVCPRELSRKFSVEGVYYFDPIAVHKFWSHIESNLHDSLYMIRKESPQPYLGIESYYEIASKCGTIFIDTTGLKIKETVSRILSNLEYESKPVKIILFSNEDQNWPERVGDELDSLIKNNHKIEKLYTKNALYISDKLKPLPIGPKWQYKSTKMYGEPKSKITKHFKNAKVESASDTKRLFLEKKKCRVMIGAMQMPDYRVKHLKDLKKNLNKEYLYDCGKNIPFDKYLECIKENMFVFSPLGYGIDCHRHWETLMMGSIPIILRSNVSPFFEDLPVWIVDDYSEVNNESIKEMYDKFNTKIDWNFEKLYIDFWKKELS